MALGPGRYDHLCTYVRERVGAVAALVIVIGGDQGSGFSVQAPPDLSIQLPTLLRRLADDIERGGPQA